MVERPASPTSAAALRDVIEFHDIPPAGPLHTVNLCVNKTYETTVVFKHQQPAVGFSLLAEYTQQKLLGGIGCVTTHFLQVGASHSHERRNDLRQFGGDRYKTK